MMYATEIFIIDDELHKSELPKMGLIAQETDSVAEQTHTNSLNSTRWEWGWTKKKYENRTRKM